MRLDHLLSRDLGACEGAGGAHGRAPWVLSWPVGGPGGRTTREHAPLSPLFCWVRGGCPPLLLWGGGGMLSGSGAACPLCPASASSCCVGGCGGVGGLVVNCIVDASIFVLCGVFLLCASRPGPAALFVVWWGLGRGFACVVCCFYGRSVDALAPGADEGRGGLR